MIVKDGPERLAKGSWSDSVYLVDSRLIDESPGWLASTPVLWLVVSLSVRDVALTQ
jgi:hypothetical protein